MQNNGDNCETCGPNGLKLSNVNGVTRVEVPQDFGFEDQGGIGPMLEHAMAVAPLIGNFRGPANGEHPRTARIPSPADAHPYGFPPMPRAHPRREIPVQRTVGTDQFTLAETPAAEVLGQRNPTTYLHVDQFTLGETAAAEVLPAGQQSDGPGPILDSPDKFPGRTGQDRPVGGVTLRVPQIDCSCDCYLKVNVIDYWPDETPSGLGQAIAEAVDKRSRYLQATAGVSVEQQLGPLGKSALGGILIRKGGRIVGHGVMFVVVIEFNCECELLTYSQRVTELTHATPQRPLGVQVPDNIPDANGDATDPKSNLPYLSKRYSTDATGDRPWVRSWDEILSGRCAVVWADSPALFSGFGTPIDHPSAPAGRQGATREALFRADAEVKRIENCPERECKEVSKSISWLARHHWYKAPDGTMGVVGSVRQLT